jgi:alpha-L-rhamnosidase
MNSFNHYAFGAIGEWMYKNILGIQVDPESPGYKHIILRPVPGGSLSWAKGSYKSIRGLIEVSWKLDNDRFNYNFRIPPNTTAKVYVPGRNINLALLEGKNVSYITENVDVEYIDGHTIFEVRPGTYSVTSELN